MDGADVCRTSSRASRRPPDVISTIAILNPRWRRWKWRHPGPGARFSIPIEEWGGKWRPFRFRSPSWVTSFVGTGNEVIQDGRRKRKGRHFPPHSSMGIEKRALYYLPTCEVHREKNMETNVGQGVFCYNISVTKDSILKSLSSIHIMYDVIFCQINVISYLYSH